MSQSLKKRRGKKRGSAEKIRDANEEQKGKKKVLDEFWVQKKRQSKSFFCFLRVVRLPPFQGCVQQQLSNADISPFIYVISGVCRSFSSSAS